MPLQNNAHCAQCDSSVNERYVVNQRGQTFCTESCCEIYYEIHSPEFKEADDDHPYYFDYASIRRMYWDWIDWRAFLQEKAEVETYPNAHVQWHADDLIDELDDMIQEYQDYVLTEGDDGVFAQEIYRYTLKFRQIQQQLLTWRPTRRLYSGIYCYPDHPDDLTTRLLEEVCTAEGAEIIQTLNRYSHPYHAYFDYIFATESVRDTVFALLFPYFDRHELDLKTYSAHLCDGGCGDYLDSEDSLYWHSGWFYCESCLDMKDVGELELEQLQRLLAHFDSHHEALQRIIHDKHGDYDRYKQLIRRACRVNQIDFPAWAVN